MLPSLLGKLLGNILALITFPGLQQEFQYSINQTQDLKQKRDFEKRSTGRDLAHLIQGDRAELEASQGHCRWASGSTMQWPGESDPSNKPF